MYRMGPASKYLNNFVEDGSLDRDDYISEIAVAQHRKEKLPVYSPDFTFELSKPVREKKLSWSELSWTSTFLVNHIFDFRCVMPYVILITITNGYAFPNRALTVDCCLVISFFGIIFYVRHRSLRSPWASSSSDNHTSTGSIQQTKQTQSWLVLS